MNQDQVTHNQQSLYQLIIDNPEDLDARRVYADFLCEQDDPRGQFIIRQFEVEESEPHSKTYILAKLESEFLLRTHCEEWESEWKQFLLKTFPAKNHRLPLSSEPQISSDIRYQYRYGFIDEFSIGFDETYKKWGESRKHAPLRKLNLGRRLFVDIRGKIQHEDLKKIRQVEFHQSNNGPQPFTFLKNVNVEALTYLKSRVLGHKNESVDLLKNSNLKNLRTLDVGSISLSDRQLATFMEANWFSNIEHLNVMGNHFGPLSAAKFAESRVAKTIKSLNLKVTNLESLCLTKISANGFPRLESIGLGWWFGVTPDADGIARFLNEDSFPKLKRMDLSRWKLNNSSLELLANSPALAGLTGLEFPDVSDDQISLFDQTTIQNLNHLGLSFANLSAQSLKRLLDGDLGVGLNSLDLSRIDAINKSPGRIFESNAMNTLLHLELGGLNADAGFEQLTKSNKLSDLVSLDLSALQISEERAKRLLDASFDSLKYLRVESATALSDKLLEKLKSRFRGFSTTRV